AAGLPERGPARTNRSRSARCLYTERRVGIELLVRWRVLEDDLSRVCVKLLRQDRRNARVYALPHFDLRHDQRNLAGSVDADIGVRCKLPVSRILWLRRLGGTNREMEGEDKTSRQCTTEYATARDLRKLSGDSHDATNDFGAEAACLMAARMRTYVPQRQMFPAMAASISESSGSDIDASSAAADMIWPD